MIDRSSPHGPPDLHPAGSRATTAAPGIRKALDRMAGMLQTQPDRLFIVPAEYALSRLGARSVSLSRWERDRGILRCLVNVGDLPPGEEVLPEDETYELSASQTYYSLTRGQGTAYDSTDPSLAEAARTMLGQFGNRSAVSVPVHRDARLWGELWATFDDRLSPGALQDALRVASEVASMVSLAEQLQTMAQLAFRDPLTGLGNRRQLDDVLGSLLADGGSGATVVICDVDELKQVNDQFGHAAGDQVIVAVADALAQLVAPSPGAMAARLGGDEFALILPGHDTRRAVESIETMSRTLARRPHPVTVSCGVATVPAGTSVRDTLGRADAAQYAAKRRGSLLCLADDLPDETEDAPRRRFRDSPRLEDRPTARTPLPSRTEQAQTCLAVRELTRALPDAPAGARHRLGWLAERVVELFDLDDWSLSTVDLDGDRMLRAVSMGLRTGHDIEGGADLLLDTSFDLTAYPLSGLVIQQGGWFAIDVRDQHADPAELDVLRTVRKRYVVAIGFREESQGLLLELYGNGPRDLDLLASTVALAAMALLGRPLERIWPTTEVPPDPA